MTNRYEPLLKVGVAARWFSPKRGLFERSNRIAAIKIIELVGISSTSWEDAAQNAVEEVAKTVRNIGGLDVINQTAIVKSDEITEYRANV